MRITDFAPYIMGERFTRGNVAPYRIDMDLYNKVAQIVKESDSAEANIAALSAPAAFYKVEPDIAHYVPALAREEIFYALKNGYASESVPSRLVFLLKRAYSVIDLPNLIVSQIPENEFEVIFQTNYLKGCCLHDVICSLFDSTYYPVTDAKPKNRHTDYTEVYVSETDMIAALPNALADTLSLSDIRNLTVTSCGLSLENYPLRTMGGLYGATNSIYDLRYAI